MEREARLRELDTAFNARDIDGALSGMTQDVDWPNGWEGGSVKGHDEVRAYWTRQWQEVDPHVEPLQFTDRPNGDVEVEVHQTVKDHKGDTLSDGEVLHVYTYDQDLVHRMTIEPKP